MSDELVFTEWGYSEDSRSIPLGFKSTEDAPEAERWARRQAEQFRAQGGRLFRRRVGTWVAVDEAIDGQRNRQIHLVQALRSATTRTWDIQQPAAIVSDGTGPDEQTSVATYPGAPDIDARIYAGAPTAARATELLHATIASFDAQPENTA